MKELGHGGEMAGKVPLGSFGHSLSTPADEDVLGKTGVGIRYLHICELHSSLGEFFNQIDQFTLYSR